MTERYTLHVQHAPHWEAHLTPLRAPGADPGTPQAPALRFRSPLDLLEWLEAQAEPAVQPPARPGPLP
ncbi:hypothetical protein [Deinococcus sedimenti]|uniref:Uncharacterized protein n=1 Tax=Deinococcus sedimenti TaxID=1867090 RepID=A0ABQ2S4H1_9DEIO|nr:hypothetical protein [Deinococcus sedimenti]GGR95667.1 hypothetical protein GCM10008960_23220 [Deinococcus sedimenti]